MLLRCRTNKGSDLGPYRAGLFYTPETRFASLRPGEAYRPLGISMYHDRTLGLNVKLPPLWYPAEAGLTVLLGMPFDTPPTLRPEWFPIGLFTVEDSTIPADWQFATVLEYGGDPTSSSLIARWGYPLLASSDEHVEALAMGDSQALAAFRLEYDKQQA